MTLEIRKLEAELSGIEVEINAYDSAIAELKAKRKNAQLNATILRSRIADKSDTREPAVVEDSA